MRDSVVLGIGSVNPVCFDQLMEEFSTSGIVREVLDKKIESNVRRRKRKELLRLQFLRVLEMSLLRQQFRYTSYADSYASGRGSSGSCNNMPMYTAIAFHIYSADHGTLPTPLQDFLEVTYQNIIQAQHMMDKDRDEAALKNLRLHFVQTVCLTISGVGLERFDSRR